MPVNVPGADVSKVLTYDYLGTAISADMPWSTEIIKLTKIAVQRLERPHKFREFGVSNHGVS